MAKGDIKKKRETQKLEIESLIEHLQFDFEIGQITADQLKRAKATIMSGPSD